MNNIHICFKSKEILRFVADLIVEYDYDAYHDLSESDKYQFAALLLKASDEDCAITDNIDKTIACLKEVLQNNNSENNQKLLETIKENVIEYYDYTMHSIFDYVYADYQAERREWLEHVGNHGNPDDIYQQYLEDLA